MFERELSIKVCGVTSVADAGMCAESGADIIGVNFARESSRCLSQDAAAEIVSVLREQFPACKIVGVFVNENPTLVRKIVTALKLDAVQLHGEETAEEIRALREFVFVIKAFRVNANTSADAVADFPCDAVLLDGWNIDKRGGTGETFDWQFAAALRPRLPCLILAGGLNAENVADAIRKVAPSAVDVCSGVEEAPGQKSAEKLQRFISAARQATKKTASLSQ